MGIWSAVSSKAQAADDRVSLGEQQASGQAFAEAIGADVVARYTVPGHSRDIVFWTDAEAEMDAYRHLREDVAAGRFDVLWALDPDRLGRDPALAQQVISLVEKSGAEVYLASSPHTIGQKTAGHRYLSAIQSVRAGEDQALRTHRHRSGMRGRVLKRQLHPSNWPRGYRAIRNGSGQVVGAEFDDEIGVVALASKLFLDGLSYEQIRERLDESAYEPSGGGLWNRNSVRQMLLNDTYAGLLSWGAVRVDTPSPHFPALWDGPTFAAMVRERRRRRAHSHGGYVRKGGGPYTGVAFCRRCGYAMTRQRSTRGHTYLRCNKHARRRMLGDGCHWNHMPEWKVTEAIAEYLVVYSTAERVDEALAELVDSQEEATARRDLAGAEKRVVELVRRRERLAHALASGDLDGGMYRTTDDALLGRLAGEEERIAELERYLAALPDLEERRRILEGLAGEFAVLVEKGEPAQVARALQEAGIRVEAEEGEVVSVGMV